MLGIPLAFKRMTHKHDDEEHPESDVGIEHVQVRLGLCGYVN